MPFRLRYGLRLQPYGAAHLGLFRHGQVMFVGNFLGDAPNVLSNSFEQILCQEMMSGISRTNALVFNVSVSAKAVKDSFIL